MRRAESRLFVPTVNRQRRTGMTILQAKQLKPIDLRPVDYGFAHTDA